LTNTGPINFTDARENIKWTFSHDSNAFKGLDLRDRRAVGELRPAGGFEAPPLLFGDGIMIAGGSLYRVDPLSGTLGRRFQLPAGETIVARPVAAGQDFAVLSDQALYFVDRSSLDGGTPAGAMVRVPLPGMIGDLQRLDLARLPDRTLVSFFFGNDGLDGPHRAWQRIVSFGRDGTAHTLAQRSLGPDYPDGLRFRSYWLSPAIRAITVAAGEVGSGSASILQRAPVEVPRGIWMVAGLLSLAAAAATALLAMRRRLRPAGTAGWTLAVLALGVPMLAAFWLVQGRSRLRSQRFHEDVSP
jgi:hypothetical protein